MSKQIEALQIIQHMDENWQEDWDGGRIRKELRRLHALNAELIEELKDCQRCFEIAADGGGVNFYACVHATRAAIAKATGEA